MNATDFLDASETASDKPKADDFLDSTADNASAISDVSEGETSPAKQALLDQKSKLAKQGANLDRLNSILGGAEKVVEPLTAAGMLNQPTRALGAVTGKPVADQFQAGKPIADIPEPTGKGFGAGLARLGIGLVKGFTTPESVVTLPFATQSKVILALFGGQMAGDLPEGVKNAVDTLNDPNASNSDKVVAVGNPIVQAAMIKGLKSQAEAPAPKVDLRPTAPNSPIDTITGRKRQMPEGAKPNMPLGEGFQTPEGKPVAAPVEVPPVAPAEVAPTQPAATEAVKPAVVEAVKPLTQPTVEAKNAPTAASETSAPEQSAPKSALKVGDTIHEGAAGQPHDALEAQFGKGQRGFIIDGKFEPDRTVAAEKTGIPTEEEAGKLHSQDVAKVKPVAGRGKSETIKIPAKNYPYGDNGSGTESVTGSVVKLKSDPANDYFAYRFSRTHWKVVEKSTGMSPGDTYGKTKAEALAKAEANIVKAGGAKKMAEVIQSADKLNGQPTPAAKPAETPAQATAKVAEHLDDVKRTEGVRPAKEIKSELVQRLEQAIEDAPKESEFDPIRGTPLTDKAKKAPTKVTINIPQDGDFTILNRQENIQELLKRAKRIQTNAGDSPNIPRSKAVGYIAEQADSAAKAYGSPENAYKSVKRQLDQLQAQEPPADSAGREVWNKQIENANYLLRELYGNTKAGILEEKAGKRQEQDVAAVESKPAIQKYRVGNNPTLHSLVEKLPASDVEKANGEQPVKVKNDKTGEVSTVMESDLTAVHEKTAAEKVSSAKAPLDDQLRAVGLDPKVFPDAASKQAALKRQKAIQPRLGKGGPGAGEASEVGTYSPIQEMADRLATTAKESQPIDGQIRAIDNAKAKLSDVRDSVKRSLSNLVAIKDAMWKKFRGLPEFGDEQKAVGKWFYALQRADGEARNFAKQIVREVPSKLRREAITNWIQAEGDEAILRDRAAASKGTLRQGYEAAINLTPREIEIAEMLRDYYDKQLENGIQSGILKTGLENYISQVWKKENPITKKLISDLSYGKLTPNFKFARKRIFESYFEGEQAGYKPLKDAGFLVANYDQSFNKSLAARAFIKDLHEGKASDGRPLVEISGNGKIVGEEGEKQSVMVKPFSKPEELRDYRTIDHPALRGWKYATTTPEGQTVLVNGDMIVHPEAYQKLKNRLSVSAFRQLPVTRAILNLQSGIKQTMLSVSGFHQVQETLHALGHRVNPMNLPEIDFSESVTRSLMEHGLQVSDYNALSDFGEGLAGGGLTAKIPIAGEKLHAYNEWLFQDYIPRLKLQMAKLTLERNRERYPNLSDDKVLELTSNEANAAFGELPYKYWGRSPTLQDALRTFLLAPDFFEARARFVGRAAMPHGREQLVALGILAATQYMTARIVNQILNKDPHWEAKNAFRIVVGNHAYGLRSIPGDLLHLFSDTRGFFYNRMSPALRAATTYITGRDDKGIKRDLLQQVEEMVKMPIPISMRSKLGAKWWESFLNAFGVQEQRWDAVQTIGQRAADFKKENKITSPVDITYNQEKDQYAALRAAVENGQKDRAQSEYDKLASVISPSKMQEHFKLSLSRPFTGSKANDQKFYASMDNVGRQEFDEAKALRLARLKSLMSLKPSSGVRAAVDTTTSTATAGVHPFRP